MCTGAAEGKTEFYYSMEDGMGGIASELLRNTATEAGT